MASRPQSLPRQVLLPLHHGLSGRLVLMVSRRPSLPRLVLLPLRRRGLRGPLVLLTLALTPFRECKF